MSEERTVFAAEYIKVNFRKKGDNKVREHGHTFNGERLKECERVHARCRAWDTGDAVVAQDVGGCRSESRSESRSCKEYEKK